MYRWLDVYLCGRYRILPPDCNAGVSSLLGSSHAEPSTGGGSAATGREVASRGGYGIAVTRRVRDLACCRIAGLTCCRNSFEDLSVLTEPFGRPIYPGGNRCRLPAV